MAIPEVLAALGLPSAPPGPVRLLAMARTPSARLRAIRIETGGRGRTLSAEAFRSLVGYHRVRSARFEWSIETDGRIRLEGVGAGHGVGLCQAGARRLSAQGRRYTEILAHYYPESRLARLPVLRSSPYPTIVGA
jgi:stage II sporulation protein D